VAARIPTVEQVSSGGVAFRRRGARVEVALVCVQGKERRWQLPKGIVEAGEAPERTAVRETREEAGIAADLVAPLDTIEYWYVGAHRGERVRFRKRVHFFLLAYRAGSVADHDHEVLEARWAALDEARGMLAFANERKVLDQAAELLGETEQPSLL
jgi:8-oxo-dGTP diphosphatase